MAASPFEYPIHYGTHIVGAGEDSTITVLSGALGVVGTFTNFQSALQPGDLFLAGGYVNFVKSIEGPEDLTLGIPWPGPTLTDAEYVVQRWMQHTDGRWIGTTITEYFAAVERIPPEIAADLEAVIAARDATFGARDKAFEWAEKTDGEVEPGASSAKQHALDAAAILVDVGEAGDAGVAAVQAAQTTGVNAVQDAQTTGTTALNGIVAQGLLDVDAIRDDVAARQTDVTNKQGVATTAATDATAARDLAQQWATNPVDDDVTGGLFSALHHATKAAASAGTAAAGATSAATTATAFDKRFLGSKAADPTQDNQGAALAVGALYWNTTIPGMRVYKGAGVWADATANVSMTRWKKVSLAAATTTLTGNDDSGLALNYTPGLEIVFLNGIALVATVDYARTNVNTITSLVGSFPLGSTVEILQFSSFTVTDAPLKANNGSDFPDKAAVRLNIGIKPPTKQIFGANGTWAKPAGCTAIRVTVIGGGGGGAGIPGAGASQVCLGGGGGGGGTAIKWITTAGATETVVVGAAGAGGAAGINAGGNGGASSFGSHCSATGGVGGATVGGGNTTYAIQGGSGGSGASGDVNTSGTKGGAGFGTYPYGHAGDGGASSLGGGGIGGVCVLAGSATGGGGGGNPGGGGGSVISCGNPTAFAGAPGAVGIVIVEEFYL